MSMEQIGDICGVSRQTIRNWMDKYDMERRGVKESHRTAVPETLKDPEQLHHELIENNKTRAQLAEELDVTEPTVARWGKIHNIGSNHEGTETVECETCGTEMERQKWRVKQNERHFCDNECRGEWVSQTNNQENNPNWKGGHHEYGPSWTQERRQIVRARDNNRCQICRMEQEEHQERWGEKLHVHHIIPAREFDNHEERNAKDNLITLCCECHKRWEGIPVVPNS